MIPACEVLVMTPRIRELLREGRAEQIPPLLADGGLDHMQTLAQALCRLVKSGEVVVEDALKAADSPTELALVLQDIRGAGHGA